MSLFGLTRFMVLMFFYKLASSVPGSDLHLPESHNEFIPNEDHDAKLKVVYETSRSACHSKGQAVQCLPPFTNIAEETQVESTSTCGESDRTDRICRTFYDTMGRQKTQCELCDSIQKHGPQFLTDRQQMNNETLWISGPVRPGQTVNLTMSLGKRFEVYYVSLQPSGQLPDSIALYKSSDFGVTWKPWQYFSTDCYRAFRLPTSSEHNAQISLANIQEVLCVALKLPDTHDPTSHSANVIAFSTTIGRPSTQPWSSALIDWMTMTDLKVSLMRFPDSKNDIQHDSNGLLLTPNMISPTKVFRVGDTDHIVSHYGSLGMSRPQYQSDAAPNQAIDNQSPVYFAFSDLAVGGRCKCNGHANRCVRDRITDSNGNSLWGPLRCDCQHNTEGPDCERCAPGYLDQPWARATTESANECKPCQCANHTKECIFSVKAFKRSNGQTGGVCVACQHNTEGPKCDQCIAGFTREHSVTIGSPYACRGCDCNLHSNSCIFSNQIYLMSMKVTGGVCQDCQHNTVGRRCHHCAPGFYRDWTKPVSHEQVCSECRCHPIGSIPNEPCDRKTGQCPCKPGVIGQACNRCQEGYKQTRLPDTPCIKAAEHFAYRRKETDYNAHPTKLQSTESQNVDSFAATDYKSESMCPPCTKSKKRIRFKKFCRREAVFTGLIKSKNIRGDLVRLEVRVEHTWRVTGKAVHLLPKTASSSLPAYPVWVRITDKLITNKDGHQIRCSCPNLQIGKSYLFISRSHQVPYGDRMELLLDTNSIILPWQESWRRRLMEFINRASRHMCESQKDDPDDPTRLRQVQRLRTVPGYYSPNPPTNQNRALRQKRLRQQQQKRQTHPSAKQADMKDRINQDATFSPSPARRKISMATANSKAYKYNPNYQTYFPKT